MQPTENLRSVDEECLKPCNRVRNDNRAGAATINSIRQSIRSSNSLHGSQFCATVLRRTSVLVYFNAQFPSVL